jgi:hypothetical protein
MIDFKVNDIIRYTGKSINSLTKNKEYVIIRKELYKNLPKDPTIYQVIYLDNNNREKKIVLDNNLWRTKFEYVSNARKEKIKKLNETIQ